MYLGIDVGSTTVKAVVMDDEFNLLWQMYERHNTQQAELVLKYLAYVKNTYNREFSLYITGSGAGPLEHLVNGKFIQEVNAVSYAVERYNPDAGSVIELGGQDAKIILYKKSEHGKKSIISMNDKCASGTGATIDKCMLKVAVDQSEIPNITFETKKLHKVAAKCGVFAETDIVNLIKTGVNSHEVLCSLADAIVQQNLSVLTRGNTLNHEVVLLGGPNTYLPFLIECWRKRIVEIWNERDYAYPKDVPVERIIYVPENSEYYAAIGAVLCGVENYASVKEHIKIDAITEYIDYGRSSKLESSSGPSLSSNRFPAEEFIKNYKLSNKISSLTADTTIDVFIGIDGGSTSSKCVLLNSDGDVIYKDYLLSKGNPIVDAKILLENVISFTSSQKAQVNISGFGVCGYAGDILYSTFNTDINVVETITHMAGANHYFPDVDVICDVGGQDIKILLLANGGLKDFRLSSQCSAGNGMLLQAMAEQFGINVKEYADYAFKASFSPVFSYGCAVFLDADRVNFQKEGYTKEEMMAGLALVLPKNIWEYVGQFNSLASLGKNFVLQGGTQYNQAALKAQVDYIKSRVPNANVYIHPHPGEAGAIGAALEAKKIVEKRGYSTFIGLQESTKVEYASTNDESTVCHFCPNLCSRTFIDTKSPSGESNRFITGNSCEKGTVESHSALKDLQRKINQNTRHYPDISSIDSRLSFSRKDTPVYEKKHEDFSFLRLFGMHKPEINASSIDISNIKIGIPKVLNIWSTAPFWTAYFEALGIKPENIIYSDDTSEELFEEGNKYGSIDPCFPSKVVQAHIHNLLYKKKGIKYIFFPSITHVDTFLENTVDSTCCPIVAGTPNVIRASFTKEVDYFKKMNVEYCDGAMNFTEIFLLEKQLMSEWGARLQISKSMNKYALEQGILSLQSHKKNLENQTRAIIDSAVDKGKMVVLLLARPYHNDIGINHMVTKELQQLGYSTITIAGIPKDRDWLNKHFTDKENPLDINDVWPENYSTNSAQKVWAATFAARCSNVAVLDLSSFKCGHDAPIYGIIDNILKGTGTPYCALHDIDANRPQGSIKIRMKTFAHTLRAKELELGIDDNSSKNKINDKDESESNSSEIILLGEVQVWKAHA